MKRRRRYQPAITDVLEGRMVLSHASVHARTALVALSTSVRARGQGSSGPAVAQVDAAYDSFVRDYTQARGVYLSLLATGSDPATAQAATGAEAAFLNYTQYRVELLGQQVVSAFLPATANLSNQKHGQNPNAGASLMTLVQARVNGLNATATGANVNVFHRGTLGFSLVSTTPDAMTSPAAASLDSLAQDQAIQASRLAVINGFNYNKSLSANKNHK